MVDVYGGALESDTTPELPEGRHVVLPGRGRTFVRTLAGPDEAPDDRAVARLDGHCGSELDLVLRRARRTLQCRRPRSPRSWSWAAVRQSVPPFRLCRRRRRARRGPRTRPGDRRRLLDGRADRPTVVAASPRRRRRPRAVRHELHVRRHATRDDPVPRRRWHCCARRTRSAHPADSRRRRCRRAVAGTPRQVVVGLLRSRPARLGADRGGRARTRALRLTTLDQRDRRARRR